MTRSQVDSSKYHELQLLTEVIYAAGAKAKKLSQERENCQDELLEMLMILSDLASKISRVQWTDQRGLHYALPLYHNIIDTL